MLTKRRWLQCKGYVEWEREGWYLFGFIPLFIRDLGLRGRVR
jgi:hypothetical protein